MGFHVQAGTASKTPTIFFNHCGLLSWCEIELVDITEKQAWKMRCFVEVEAYQQGYHSKANDQPWNPFEPEFLFGEPYHRWNELFQEGRSDKAQGLAPDNHQYGVWEMPELNLWPSVVAALEASADITEAAFHALGMDKKSLSRGIVHALVGWFNTSDGDFVSAM
jgi:hypothetical protein